MNIVESNSKPLMQSKTFWLNVAAIGIAIGGVIPSPWGMIAIAISNVINRFFTEKPIDSVV